MKNLSKCQTKKKKKKKSGNTASQLCGYSSLQERLFWHFSFSHSVKMPLSRDFVSVSASPHHLLPNNTYKQGPINQPSEPCSFQLLRTLFLQCFGSQQSKVKPGPHFVHASCYDMCIQVSFKIIILSIQI